jgi:hypothetical protein
VNILLIVYQQKPQAANTHQMILQILSILNK